jgi:hypothetical protein
VASGMDWGRASQRDMVRDRGSERLEPPEPKSLRQKKPRSGPTGEQQKRVAELCRRRGVAYTYPATAAAADADIKRLLAETRRAAGRSPSV